MAMTKVAIDIMNKAYQQYQDIDLSSDEFLDIVAQQQTLAKQQNISFKDFLETHLMADPYGWTTHALIKILSKEAKCLTWCIEICAEEKVFETEKATDLETAIRNTAIFHFHMPLSILALLPPPTVFEKNKILGNIADELFKLSRHPANDELVKKISDIMRVYPAVFQFINSNGRNLAHIIACKAAPPENYRMQLRQQQIPMQIQPYPGPMQILPGPGPIQILMPMMPPKPYEEHVYDSQSLFRILHVLAQFTLTDFCLVDEFGNTPSAYLFVTQDIPSLGALYDFLCDQGFSEEKTFILSSVIDGLGSGRDDPNGDTTILTTLTAFMDDRQHNHQPYHGDNTNIFRKKCILNININALILEPSQNTLAELLRKMAEVLAKPTLVNNAQRKDLLEALISFLSPEEETVFSEQVFFQEENKKPVHLLTDEMRQDYHFILRQLAQHITISVENKQLLRTQLGNVITSLKTLCFDKLAAAHITTPLTPTSMPKSQWETTKTFIQTIKPFAENIWHFFGEKYQASLSNLFDQADATPNKSDKPEEAASQAASISGFNNG